MRRVCVCVCAGVLFVVPARARARARLPGDAALVLLGGAADEGGVEDEAVLGRVALRGPDSSVRVLFFLCACLCACVCVCVRACVCVCVYV